jgi:hypothetical protein
VNTEQLKEALRLKTLVQGEQREITGCYIGDLLSWVMSRAQEGDAWLTVMGNINAIGVASLADCACIILTENAALDENARAKAEALGISIFTTEENSYAVAVEISKLI